MLLQAIDQPFTKSLQNRFSKHALHAYSMAVLSAQGGLLTRTELSPAYENTEKDMESDRLTNLAFQQHLVALDIPGL
jgi:hypothetical protein